MNLWLFLLPISDCQWECEQSVEPMGAAVCVWEHRIDSEAESILHIILTWRCGESAIRTDWWMDRLLCWGNLQPAVAPAYQDHRYECKRILKQNHHNLSSMCFSLVINMINIVCKHLSKWMFINTVYSMPDFTSNSPCFVFAVQMQMPSMNQMILCFHWQYCSLSAWLWHMCLCNN